MKSPAGLEDDVSRRMVSRHRGRRSIATGAIALASLILATLPACSSPRNTLGTNSSPCFLALPVAADAVHHRGELAGVRLVKERDLARHPHLQSALQRRAGGPTGDLCAVEYKGSYTIDQVEHPLGDAPAGGVGHFAVVVVAKQSDELLGTFVLAEQPLRFHHQY